MRIVHLLKHGIQGNGHVHVAVDLSCAQSAAGHDVVFAAGETDYAELLDAHGVRVVELPSTTNLRTSVTYAAAIGRVLWTLRPDLVHAHMMSSALLAYPWTRALAIPLVTTVHNSFDRHSVMMRLGDRVVAVSKAERELLLSRGYPARKVVTILNRVIGSPRDALADEDPVEVPRPSIMTLGGLHRRKAVGDVIAAFEMVQDRFSDWHLNIVGWGPDKERLEQLTADLGLEERVHFLGSTRSSRAVLQQTEVFATGTLADPCPLTVIEARGAGCAIVATRVGGIPEALEGGRAGILVPKEDPAAMAEAFALLLGDKAARDRMRAAALDGSDNFSVTRMSDEHLELYAGLLSRSNRPLGPT